MPFEVVENNVPAEGLILNHRSWTFSAGQEWDTTFDVIVNPSDANADGLTCVSSAPDLVTAKCGTVNYYGRVEHYVALHVTGNAKPGDTATITVSLNDLHERMTILFIDPDAPAPANPFVDVKEGAFYYDAVLWAVNAVPQITNGTDATHFSPKATCKRCQVVTFLWRAMGQPEPTTTVNPFKDVRESAYYYKAVLWAVENGITNGVDPTHFGPDRGCTRGQVVAFLWRAEGEPKPKSLNNPFSDVAEGKFYYDAVLWANGMNITNGTDATHFSPDATCTRGQIVTFLMRDILG